MESMWKENFEVKSYHVDFQMNIKPSALMQFFQEVASNHAAALGAGYDTLIVRDLFWALSRLTVEITRMPRWGETILIETWPCGSEGLFFRRDFIVYDQDHQVLLRAVSGWLLLATATLRPQRPSILDITLPFNHGKRSLDYFPERISVKVEQTVFHKKVAYNEIDQNLHVNNTRYLDWATDCFDLDQYQKNRITQFTLEFLAETHWGDEIELRMGVVPNVSEIEALDRSTGSTLFKALINWDSLVER
jgi:medium-chain acyl-[acyl-carrier-protein] hydrolase